MCWEEGFKFCQPPWPLGCHGNLSLSQCQVDLGMPEGKLITSWLTALIQARLRPSRWRGHYISDFDTLDFQDSTSRINIFIFGLAQKSLCWPAGIRLSLDTLSQGLKASGKGPLNVGRIFPGRPLAVSSLPCFNMDPPWLLFFPAYFPGNRMQVFS